MFNQTPTHSKELRSRWRPALATLLLLASLPAARVIAGQPGDVVRLAENGQARLAISIGSRASAQTAAAARDLAAGLGRIAGCVFPVATNAGGIIVGTPADFDTSPAVTDFHADDPWQRETYILRSDGASLVLLGATDTAVTHAVWDLLRRLGYRHFFPGAVWEVYPRSPDLTLAIDETVTPDYPDRRLHYLVFNRDPAAAEDHRLWCKHNRVGAGLKILSHHAYQGFYKPLQKAFEAHPEYLPLVNGRRTYWPNSFKPCLSNADCRRLIVEHACNYFREHPAAESISMEPSDLKNWCQCAECAARPTSDWATLLANEVAEAINAPEANPPFTRYVGLLAYNAHDAPPTLRVDPRVMVTITSHFHDNPISREATIEGWRRQGAVLLGFDHNAGGEGAVRNLPEIRREIVRLHRDHRLFRWSTAGGVQWGFFGLGAYCTAQALWSVAEAEQFDALLDDFYQRAFGPAAAPMAVFFRLFNRMTDADPWPPVIDSAVIGRMYRQLDEAFRLTAGDAECRARVIEWLWFTCHVDLQARIPATTDSWRKVGAMDEQTRLAYWARTSRLFLLPEHLRNQTEWLPIKDDDGLPGKPDDAGLDEPLLELAARPVAPPRDTYARRVLDLGLRAHGLARKEK